jgi:hypothetical protein
MNSNRDYFLSMNMFTSDWLVSTPHKFPAHNNIALVKTRANRAVCTGKWIHSSQYNFYLEFPVQKYNKYNLLC